MLCKLYAACLGVSRTRMIWRFRCRARVRVQVCHANLTGMFDAGMVSGRIGFQHTFFPKLSLGHRIDMVSLFIPMRTRPFAATSARSLTCKWATGVAHWL